MKANKTIRSDDYIYFDLDKPLELRKGFIGQLWVDEIMNFNELKAIKNVRSVRSDDFNLIKVVNAIDDEWTSLKSLTNALMLTSFQYTFTNRSDVEIKLQKLKLANQVMKQSFYQIQAKLITESTNYNDIKFIDIIDTYRNLPEKLLKFISFIDSRHAFKYFIKVDDDTFLNLPNILKNINDDQDDKKAWFGK